MRLLVTSAVTLLISLPGVTAIEITTNDPIPIVASANYFDEEIITHKEKPAEQIKKDLEGLLIIRQKALQVTIVNADVFLFKISTRQPKQNIILGREWQVIDIYISLSPFHDRVITIYSGQYALGVFAPTDPKAYIPINLHHEKIEEFNKRLLREIAEIK